MTTVRERRFQITLWTSDDSFSKEKEYICELQSCQLQFQLSSIPQAIVKPAFGIIINSPEDAKKQATSFAKLMSLAKDRSAVKIILKVTQSFKSENNEADSYEWPFSGDEKPDAYGQYESKPITIFEGFICPPSAEVTAINSGITLTIQHWLSSLANVSLLTTACHTSNPTELSLQCYNTLALSASTQGNKAKWIYIDTNLEPSKDLWKNGIKKLFKAVLDQGNKTLNRFTQKQRKRIETALNRINKNDKDKLQFRDLQGGAVLLEYLVQSFLETEIYQTFIHTSAWDKLVGYYSSSFLFSLSPRVKDALLIPTPCAIDPKKVVEIKDDDILQISSSPLSTTQLSRLYCVASMAENRAASDDGRETLFAPVWYPDYDQEDNIQDGYIQSIAYPEWLMRTPAFKLPAVSEMPNPFSSVEDLQKAKEAAKKNAKAAGEQKDDISKNLARAFTCVSYLIQSFNSTWACVVTPARMDICTGTAVHCTVRSGTDTELDLYGTVTGEVIRFVSGKSTPTTQFTLSNIRTNKTINDPVTNPSERPLGYYKEEWDGRGRKLYD